MLLHVINSVTTPEMKSKLKPDSVEQTVRKMDRRWNHQSLFLFVAQHGDSGNSSPARGSPQRFQKVSLDDATVENNNYNGSPVTMRNGSTSSQDAAYKSSPSHGMHFKTFYLFLVRLKEMVKCYSWQAVIIYFQSGFKVGNFSCFTVVSVRVFLYLRGLPVLVWFLKYKNRVHSQSEENFSWIGFIKLHGNVPVLLDK